MSTISQDETQMETAERAAQAISTCIAMTAHRAALYPHGAEVPSEEMAAYYAMRDALNDLASFEYDRGFRRAVAMRKENRGGADA